MMIFVWFCILVSLLCSIKMYEIVLERGFTALIRLRDTDLEHSSFIAWAWSSRSTLFSSLLFSSLISVITGPFTDCKAGLSVKLTSQFYLHPNSRMLGDLSLCSVVSGGTLVEYEAHVMSVYAGCVVRQRPAMMRPSSTRLCVWMLRTGWHCAVPFSSVLVNKQWSCFVNCL
jgi:hypothetical protein